MLSTHAHIKITQQIIPVVDVQIWALIEKVLEHPSIEIHAIRIKSDVVYALDGLRVLG